MAIKANTAREHWANQVHQQSALTTVVHTHDWHQIDWITLWQNDDTVRTTKGRWRDVGRATATVAGSIACGRYTRKCFIVCSSAYLFCTDDWRPTTMQLRLQLEPQTFLTVVSHPPFSPAQIYNLPYIECAACWLSATNFTVEFITDSVARSHSAQSHSHCGSDCRR